MICYTEIMQGLILWHFTCCIIDLESYHVLITVGVKGNQGSITKADVAIQFRR